MYVRFFAIIVELGTTMDNFLLRRKMSSRLLYVSITWLKSFPKRKKKTEEILKVSKTNMIANECD